MAKASGGSLTAGGLGSFISLASKVLAPAALDLVTRVGEQIGAHRLRTSLKILISKWIVRGNAHARHQET